MTGKSLIHSMIFKKIFKEKSWLYLETWRLCFLGGQKQATWVTAKAISLLSRKILLENLQKRPMTVSGCLLWTILSAVLLSYSHYTAMTFSIPLWQAWQCKEKMMASHTVDLFIIQNQFCCLHIASIADCKYDRIKLQNNYWQNMWVDCLVAEEHKDPLKTLDDNVIQADDSSELHPNQLMLHGSLLKNQISFSVDVFFWISLPADLSLQHHLNWSHMLWRMWAVVTKIKIELA